MKIGIDARMYGTGFTGIGRYTAELINHLARLDDHNEYVLFMRKEAFDDFKCPNERFKKRLADFSHYSMGEQWGFNRLLKAEKLDLMHFTHFNAPLLYKGPFVVTIHDLTLSFFPGKKMNHWYHRVAYHKVIKNVTQKAKCIIAVSENTKYDLVNTLHVSEKKVSVIYNGISPHFGGIKPTSKSALMKGTGLSKPFFLYTGVWRDHKNVVGLIKAFASFNAAHDTQYELVITGKPNTTYQEVPDAIRSLGVEGQVHLVGLVSEEDLYGLYQNALAYVFPSFYEGFGLPPLEAMQCGTPVLASNTSAIPEVCGEGNALFFDPYDLKDMQSKMEQMATDEALRRNLIQRGGERVKAFSWDKMTQAVMKIYDRLGIRH